MAVHGQTSKRQLKMAKNSAHRQSSLKANREENPKLTNLAFFSLTKEESGPEEQSAQKQSERKTKNNWNYIGSDSVFDFQSAVAMSVDCRRHRSSALAIASCGLGRSRIRHSLYNWNKIKCYNISKQWIKWFYKNKSADQLTSAADACRERKLAQHVLLDLVVFVEEARIRRDLANQLLDQPLLVDDDIGPPFDSSDAVESSAGRTGIARSIASCRTRWRRCRTDAWVGLFPLDGWSLPSLIRSPISSL